MKLSNDDCFQFIDTGIIDTFVYRLVQFSFPPHPALLDLGVSLIRPQGLNHGNPALRDCCDWSSGSLVNPEAKSFTKRKQTIHHTPPEKKEPRRTHKRKAPVGYLR
jgi:hypothetical protein